MGDWTSQNWTKRDGRNNWAEFSWILLSLPGSSRTILSCFIPFGLSNMGLDRPILINRIETIRDKSRQFNTSPVQPSQVRSRQAKTDKAKSLQVKTSQAKAGQDKPRHIKTGRHKSSPVKSSQVKTSQDKSRQVNTRQKPAKASQARSRQVNTRQIHTSQV